MSKVIVVQGEDPFQMVEKGLKFFGKPAMRMIVIKPNLILAENPPTTTPCEVVEALVLSLIHI